MTDRDVRLLWTEKHFTLRDVKGVTRQSEWAKQSQVGPQ